MAIKKKKKEKEMKRKWIWLTDIYRIHHSAKEGEFLTKMYSEETIS